MNINQSNIKFNSNMSYGNRPDTIVLHHAEASNCSVYDVDSWHKGNGWAGIGYHYFVRKDGSVWTGRPENAIGAHCPSMNSHSIGVCAEGEYMREQMPEIQKQALIELGQYIKNKYGLSRVGGHKEYYSTDCPGTNYPLEAIKASILSGAIAPVASAVQNISQVQQGDNTVKTIQTQLNTLFKCGLVVDGFDGTNTTKWKKAFQTAMGLTADGIWGPLTASAMNAVLARTEDGVPYPHYEYATRYIQYRVGGSIDGCFGNGTKINVQNWQAQHGLTPDGIVGHDMWIKLLDQNC